MLAIEQDLHNRVVEKALEELAKQLKEVVKLLEQIERNQPNPMDVA